MARGVRITSALITRDAYRALGQIRNLGEDQSPLFDIWGNILEGSVRARFDSGRGPGGVPWIPSKRVLGIGTVGPLNGKTLVDKGNLERSLRYEVRPNQLVIGFDGVSESSKHAGDLQFGSNRQTVVQTHYRTITSAFGVPLKAPVRFKVRGHPRMTNLPARPMLGIDNNDRRDLTDAAQEYVRGLLE